MKIQVALAAGEAIARGHAGRPPAASSSARAAHRGQTGISLLRDEVHMSVRDLLTQMLTVSDNVATDELIALVGLDRINALTATLDLASTVITSDLQSTLDAMAQDAGFTDYLALAALDADAGPPSMDQVRQLLHDSAALDPARGSRTTAAETVRLLQAMATKCVSGFSSVPNRRHCF